MNELQRQIHPGHVCVLLLSELKDNTDSPISRKNIIINNELVIEACLVYSI